MKRTSIKRRLVTTLLIFIAAFIGFGTFTIIMVRQLENMTNSIYEDPLRVSAAATEARVDIIKIQDIYGNIIIYEDEVEINRLKREAANLEKEVYKKLENIKNYDLSKESLQLQTRVKENFIRFRENHELILDYLEAGNREMPKDINHRTNMLLFNSMEQNLVRIDSNAKQRAAALVTKANRIQDYLKSCLIILNVVLSIFFIGLFSLVIRSILHSIDKLQQSMSYSAVTGILSEAELDETNEISGIAYHYNILIQKLRNQFWLKDGQNFLNQELSTAVDLLDMQNKALYFIVKTIGASKGAFYAFNEARNYLELKASYAYTEKERQFAEYSLGEGVIGQVGLDKQPIHMENVMSNRGFISTGVIIQAPIHVYTFPLIYENKLLGVIELAAYEVFDELKCEFLREAANIIATDVYSETQSQKVKSLLEISEKAQLEAKYNASQLQKINAELETQQRLMQQQSAEQQQANMQLEEQQRMLEEQTKLLNIRNQQLENSRMELLKHAKEAENANRYKSQFLTNMSHELRTPLNSIILLSRLMMKNENKQLHKDDIGKLDVIHKSGQELLRLINDILDLSKIEAGKMTVNCDPFYPIDLITELKQLFAGVAAEKGIKLIYKDLYKDKLYGDRNKISQIMRNLVINAIKFTEVGQVTIEIKPDGGTGALLSVVDTGIGISKDDLERIFEEFHQADGSTSRKYGGTGLGLPISQKLAEVMDGEIVVHSEEGKGSSFILHLKNVSLHTSKDINICNEVSNDPVSSEAAATVELESKTILVIEKDKDFAEYIKRISTDMGFNTIIALTGAEGLRFARALKVDAAILELSLSDMNGIEVLQEMKSIKDLRGIPVQVISAEPKTNKPQRFGAVGYKQKPIEEKEMVEIINHLIKTKEKTPKQLLIIEDAKAHQKRMKLQLEDADTVIDIADSDEEALSWIESKAYDAIILETGLDLSKRLNICKYIEDKELKVPVIIYSEKNLTAEQELEIGKYIDSIVIKIADSDSKLLDEVMLFLHRTKKNDPKPYYLLPRQNKKHSLILESKRIMIADDDPRNVFVLASALEDLGAEVLEAENGRHALEILEQQPIDLVLMDIMMPVMDGYETIKAIRSNKATARIPIIAVTAKSLIDDKEKCIAAGANDYISKPIDYDLLIQLVNTWISK